MLIGVDEMPAYERQMLLIFKMAIENSPQFNQSQKTIVEHKLQEIVEVCVKKDFV